MKTIYTSEYGKMRILELYGMLESNRFILWGISLKTNEYLKFAVITGCLRISKESIFTGVNNFACYSVTSRKFRRYFGCMRDEVDKTPDVFGLTISRKA